MDSKLSVSVTQALKEQTDSLHRRAESTRFFISLMRCQATIPDYITFLRMLSIVHSVLEKEITSSENEKLKLVWQDNMRKLPLLNEDIQSFTDSKKNSFSHFSEIYADATQPIHQALELVQKIKTLALKNPLQLVGVLYVTEGFTNSGVYMNPRITQAYGLSGDIGIRYLKNYGEAQPAEWNDFKRRLELAITSDEELAEVLIGAKYYYEQFILMFDSLGTSLQPRSVQSTSINPEAGNHPVPQNELELRAVFIASKASLVELPYVHARYGKRGESFSDSDGAWLVTLADFSEKVAFKQTEWLAKLLSALGMPSVTLEIHLREIAKALMVMIPEECEKYSVLLRAAEQLELKRHSVVPQELQEEVCQEFRRVIASTEIESYKNLERILVSTMADERIFGTGAQTKTLAWIYEKSNYPKHIIQATQKLVQRLNDCIKAQ